MPILLNKATLAFLPPSAFLEGFSCPKVAETLGVGKSMAVSLLEVVLRMVLNSEIEL